MQTIKFRKLQQKAVDKISKSQHVIPNHKRNVPSDPVMYKTVSQKKIPTDSQIPNRLKFRHLRSLTTGTNNMLIARPYQKFVKDLEIVLPTPQQKFQQFMEIAPYNRNSHHLELIEHFLKQYTFFKNHPRDLLAQISNKVKISKPNEIQKNSLLVVERGQCFHGKQNFVKGEVLGRKQLKESLTYSPQTQFITIVRHDYEMLISNYLLKEKEHFRSFLSSIQIFKMFSKKAFEKFMGNLSIKFLNAGEYLYKFGDDARHLHIVYKGKASRKVIVELDKINKIPMLRYSKIIKIMSKSYEHKIQFEAEDLIGIAEVIDHIETRKENIKIEENSIVLGLEKNIFQENLDEYIIDRLRKYNLKKYPVTYDKLCQKFEKDQVSIREEELRKIDALKRTINHNTTEKRSQKINKIIKTYQENIKKSQIMNLLECKIQERKMQRQ